MEAIHFLIPRPLHVVRGHIYLHAFGKFRLDESFCVVSRVKLSNADEKFEREVREEAEGHAPFSTSAMVIT